MTCTGPYQGGDWLADDWDISGNRTITVKDPIMYADNIELRRDNDKLREKVKRLEVTEKKYNVLKKLADRMKADKRKLFSVGVLKKCLKNG